MRRKPIYEGMEAVRSEFGFLSGVSVLRAFEPCARHGTGGGGAVRLELVRAVPVPKAAVPWRPMRSAHCTHACLTETVQAHAGIDIGDTFIGMHLTPW